MTLLELLRADLDEALQWNQNAEVAPVCLLWPDEDRLFASAFTRLSKSEPRFYELGSWDEAAGRGPAIWLRWKLDSGGMAAETGSQMAPILYLGGVSRAHLRPNETTRDEVKPLCELAFRGRAWRHESEKDWTPLAWLLKHGVAVAADAATREALARALPKLWDLKPEDLNRRGTLRAGDFDEILNPEPVENLLSWMNDAAKFQGQCDNASWESFVSICDAKFGFSPARDGVVGAAEHLARAAGAWQVVWRNFERNPARWSGVIAQLEKLQAPKPQQGALDFDGAQTRFPSGCAQSETEIRVALAALNGQSANEARAKISELEAIHGVWRESVWAQLGRAPLARALEKLVELGARTAKSVAGGAPEQMAQTFADEGWKTDALVLDILALGVAAPDLAVLKSATRALYAVWLDETARSFGAAVAALGGALPMPNETPTKAGVAVLFADGLRYDLAQRARTKLEAHGLKVELGWRFGPLPGVTATAKPAVAPIDDARFIGGDKLNVDWADGRKQNAANLRAELEKLGFAALSDLNVGEPKAQANAWTESGNFDGFGHAQGARMALQLEDEIERLAARIASLVEGGWREVEVVTDHGWLLLPGGLSKAQLPEGSCEVRKGRCARLKPNQDCEFETVPWHWDKEVSIAIAPGARCFEAGREYEHGGLSLQECVLPVLRVSSGKVALAETGEIIEAKWSGFRLRVQSRGGARLDLRTHLGDANSSLCGGAKIVESSGKTALVVEDDGLAGAAAHLILLDANDGILAKLAVTVGDS